MGFAWFVAPDWRSMPAPAGELRHYKETLPRSSIITEPMVHWMREKRLRIWPMN